MKLSVLGILSFFLSSFSLFAQEASSVKGSVLDTASGIGLVNTSISILNSKDSTLYKFTRAGANGGFSINDLTKGEFILLVTYPGYADYVEHFSLDSAKSTRDFGKLNMILKARLLEEVIIKGTAAAIKIRGDTTEFNAAAYQIQPNSKVEDLLKQLPGIQVDKDGKITAQGQTVNKVLVDGEEFFGDDPTLVTKNIRGDMVDKVQLYDKKSDQAAFTGIDDGEKTKTINIKLKEDKKNGYFGKLDMGGGTDDYYQGQGMFNSFKGKTKFSAYGTLGNTGKTGLTWRDNSKYGSSNIEVMDGGMIMISNMGSDELDSFDGRYNGEGFPLARSGGVHYDTKWKGDKQSINLNYKIGSINIDGLKNGLTQNNLPSGIINSNSGQAFENYMFRQKLDATYQVKIDSTSNLKISVDGTLKNTQSQSNYLASSIRGNGVFLNEGKRSLTNDGEQRLFNASALWTKQLKKKGRTLSFDLKQTFSRNETQGYLNSDNSFYNTLGTLDSTQLIDQYKTNNIISSVFNSNLAYTEPLSKRFSLILNYGLGLNNSSADRKSFNQSAGVNYDVLDAPFSNDFRLDQVSNQAGATFNYRKDKTIVNFGTKFSGVNFKQIDFYTGKEYKRNFLTWNPQASYQYNFSQQKSLRGNFYGNTTQPNIDQIQPVRINNDPLNITLGNPDLRPSFNSWFSMGYNSYKVLSNQAIYINGSYSFTSNAIVNNTTTDAAGKNTYQSINLTDKTPSNFNFYSYWTQKIEQSDLSLGLNLSSNGNTYFNLINYVFNKTQSYRYSARVTASQIKQKKIELYFAIGPEYNTSESSLQRQINNNGWGLNSDLRFSVYLPGKTQISSDATYTYKEKTQSFDQNFNRMIWNTTLSKKFLKAESLVFSLSGNDLLNQNLGFNRNAFSNMITQNSYTTIKRYFMVSLVYDFSKMGGIQAPK